MARSKHWGPPPPGRGTPASPGKAAVGEDSLGSGVADLHQQHPHDVHGEGLQHKSVDKRHMPVGSVYKGK